MVLIDDMRFSKNYKSEAARHYVGCVPQNDRCRDLRAGHFVMVAVTKGEFGKNQER